MMVRDGVVGGRIFILFVTSTATFSSCRAVIRRTALGRNRDQRYALPCQAPSGWRQSIGPADLLVNRPGGLAAVGCFSGPLLVGGGGGLGFLNEACW